MEWSSKTEVLSKFVLKILLYRLFKKATKCLMISLTIESELLNVIIFFMNFMIYVLMISLSF